MRVLITGAGGFVGSHLAKFTAKKKGVRLFGLTRRDCDVRDEKKLSAILKKAAPDRIFHLAASASVKRSWEEPKLTFLNNVEGTRSLMESVKRSCPKARVLVTSSAEVYGGRKSRQKLRESSKLRPANPYAVSKVLQELVAYRYFSADGLHVVRTRAFNHIGPGQSDAYVVSSFAKQTACIEAGLQKPVLKSGNLNAVRDFTDVRDVVRAYWLCLEKGEAGDVYNISSGRGRRIGEMLRYYLGRSVVTIKPEKDPRRMRAADPSSLVGDSGKLRRRTGWCPEFSFEESLSDILDHWRKKIEVDL